MDYDKYYDDDASMIYDAVDGNDDGDDGDDDDDDDDDDNDDDDEEEEELIQHNYAGITAGMASQMKVGRHVQ